LCTTVVHNTAHSSSDDIPRLYLQTTIDNNHSSDAVYRRRGGAVLRQLSVVAVDPDDPEYLRELRRPADVKQDVRQMQDRQRVQLVLRSKAFRSELERLVDERIRSGEPCPPSLIALQQQISGLNLPQSRLKHGALIMQGTTLSLSVMIRTHIRECIHT